MERAFHKRDPALFQLEEYEDMRKAGIRCQRMMKLEEKKA